MNQVFKNSAFNAEPLVYRAQEYLDRLNRLQSFVKESGVEVLLLVVGPDGNNNDLSANLVKWLFYGCSPSQFFETPAVTEEMADLIIAVASEKVKMYADRKFQRKMTHLLVATPHLDLFCPLPEMYEDTGLIETYKITQFFNIVCEYSLFGFVLGKSDKGTIKSVEKWPIIQSYAFPAVKAAFFSSLNRPVDLTQKLKEHMGNVDNQTKRLMVMELGERLANTTNDSLKSIDSTKPKYRHKELTEMKVNSTQIEVYEYALVDKKMVYHDSQMPKPRVLFGVNTSLPIGGAPQPKNAVETGGEGKNALHLTIENVEPLQKIRVLRTFFLSRNVPVYQYAKALENEEGYEYDYQFLPQDNETYQDECLLAHLYVTLLRIYSIFTKSLPSNLNLASQESLHKVIHAKIKTLLSKYHKKAENVFKFDESNVTVSIFLVDNWGKEKTLKEMGLLTRTKTPSLLLHRHTIVIRVQIDGIHSGVDGRLLGSIGIGDSFLIENESHYCITSKVPLIDIWDFQAEQSLSLLNMKELHRMDRLGTKLEGPLDRVQVYIPISKKLLKERLDLPTFSAKVTLYEKGIKVISDKLGVFFIFFDELLGIHMHRRSQTPWALFEMRRNFFLPKLTYPFICMRFHDEALQKIYIRITTFGEDYTRILELEQLPDFFQNSFAMSLGAVPPPYMQLEILSPEFFVRFMDFTKCIRQESLSLSPEQLAEKLEDKEKTNLNEAPEKPWVVFCIGPFGSGKSEFAKNVAGTMRSLYPRARVLVELSTGVKEWEEIAKRIQEVIEKNEDMSVLVVKVPFFCDHTQLVLHAEHKMHEKLQVLSVLAKIDASQTLNPKTLGITPGLPLYLQRGFVRHVFLDSSDKDDMLFLQVLGAIEDGFPHVKVFKCQGNMVTSNSLKEVTSAGWFFTEEQFLVRQSLLEAFQNGLLNPNSRRVKLTAVSVGSRQPVKRELLNEFLEKIKLNGLGLLTEDEFIDDSDKKILGKDYLKKSSKDIYYEEMQRLKQFVFPVQQFDSNRASRILMFRGLVRFAGHLGEGVYEVTFMNGQMSEKLLPGTKASSQISEKGLEEVSYASFSPEEMNMTFFGHKITEESIENLLLSLAGYTTHKGPKSHEEMKIEDIPSEKVEELEQKYREEDHVDGSFYDGYQFRDGYGKPMKHHPSKNTMIDLNGV